jgi:hypothetical protein
MGKKLKLSHESVRSLMKRLRTKTGLHRKPQMAVWANEKREWLKARLAELPASRRKTRKKAA